MPPPPASLEAGPNSPQPGPNVAWTPGYWTWQGGGYAWRPGFWAAVQPNWIWMPPHYVWTPSGYLFVPGYWDLPVANRGLMFAPVYYPQPVYAQPGFAFTPSISIVGSAVTSNLFVSVGTNQYLFGNLLRPGQRQRGDRPVVLVQLLGRPAGLLRPAVLVLCGCERTAEPAVDRAGAGSVRPAPENVALRPPVTYAEQVRVMRNVSITRDITVVDHRTWRCRCTSSAADPIAGRNLRMVRVCRGRAAADPAPGDGSCTSAASSGRRRSARWRRGGADRPRTVSLPHSPVAAHPAEHTAGHPGGDGARAAVAHRDDSVREREAGRSAERAARGRTRAGGRGASGHARKDGPRPPAVGLPVRRRLAGAPTRPRRARANGDRNADRHMRLRIEERPDFSRGRAGHSRLGPVRCWFRPGGRSRVP